MANHDVSIERFRVTPSNPFSFADTERFPTKFRGFCTSDGEYEKLLRKETDRMAVQQEMLHASGNSALLVAIQALDAAGKDGLVEHGFSGLNVAWTRAKSYKAPTKDELAEHYLARHDRALPELGELGVWIRSHYEELITVRVHPQFLKGRGVDISTVDEKFWAARTEEVKEWEELLPKGGRRIAKIFLNASTDVRMERLLERLEDARKHWKSNLRDIEELAAVPDYNKVIEAVINATSTADAPWYVLPADDKRDARVLGARVVNEELEKMDLRYPSVNDDELSKMRLAAINLRRQLGKKS